MERMFHKLAQARPRLTQYFFFYRVYNAQMSANAVGNVTGFYSLYHRGIPNVNIIKFYYAGCHYIIYINDGNSVTRGRRTLGITA